MITSQYQIKTWNTILYKQEKLHMYFLLKLIKKSKINLNQQKVSYFLHIIIIMKYFHPDSEINDLLSYCILTGTPLDTLSGLTCWKENEVPLRPLSCWGGQTCSWKYTHFNFKLSVKQWHCQRKESETDIVFFSLLSYSPYLHTIFKFYYRGKLCRSDVYMFT